MSPLARTAEELQEQPALATLAVLVACINAVTTTLDVLHPDLPRRPPGSEREAAAMMLLMHLHACQELLGLYDHLAFDLPCFSNAEGEDPDDEIPF